jgi:hypothetical protein
LVDTRFNTIITKSSGLRPTKPRELGDLDEHDPQPNQDALADKDRLFSAYLLPKTQHKPKEPLR